MDQVSKTDASQFILPSSTNPKTSRHKATGQLHLHLPHVPSIANLAAALRASVSTFSIKSLAEDPTRTCHPTQQLHGFKVPTFVNSASLSEEVVEWGKTGPAMRTSGRLVQADSHVQLVCDPNEKTLVTEKDNCYIYFQALDANFKSIQQTCDVFYVLYTDKHSYASTAWHTLDRPNKNEYFLIPYSDTLRIALYLRFPVSENRRKFFSTFKKKPCPESLGGTDIALADITLDLLPIDFGRETKKLPLNTSPKLANMLKKSFDIHYPELTINFGVWSGATVRMQNEKEASYADFLTVSLNPNQPRKTRFWATIDVQALELHLCDFEEREKKRIRSLSLETVAEIDSDPQELEASNTFFLHFPKASDLESSQVTLISQMTQWRCCADDPAGFENWVKALTKAVDLAKKRAKRAKAC